MSTVFRRCIVGTDHGGVALRAPLLDLLAELRIEVVDFGTAAAQPSVDYPDFAHKVTEALQTHEDAFGLLVCGSGQGMAMAANKHPRVRAALCEHALAARLAREHNSANVLCLGARLIGPGVAVDTLRAFATTPFAGGRHTRRVDKIAGS